MADEVLNEMAGRRSLLYFPIVHTEADMGALGEAVERLAVSRQGRRGRARTVGLIDQLWTRIEQAIAGLDLCYRQVRVYQDGLPECGRELEIVAELARAESRNHKLLLKLLERGATIMGTESPDLLMEEYRLATEALAPRHQREAARTEARQKAARDALLGGRDRFIAARINRTLAGGETGILFLGALHSLAGLLDKEIQVVYPLHRPAARAARL